MSNTRAPYPPEFRQQMVELVRAGRSPEELARELEPSAQAIRNWMSRADRDEGGRSDGLTSGEREGLRRRENRQLRQEREILAKALRWPFRTPGRRVSTNSPRTGTISSLGSAAVAAIDYAMHSAHFL